MKKLILKKIEENLIQAMGLGTLGYLENSCGPLGFRVPLTKFPPPGNRYKTPTGLFRKKTIHRMGLVLLAVFLAVGSAMAQDLAPDKQWIEQVNGGVIFPVSSKVSASFAQGYGSEFVLGYRFNQDFSLSTSFGYYDCDQKRSGASAGEWLYMPLMETARCNFGEGWLRPYVLLGAGAAFNSYGETVPFGGSTQKLTHSETDFLLSPGLGTLFILFPKAALYVQGRLDLDFTTGKSLNSPAVDGPTLFIPLQAGISFFVL